MQDWRTRGWTIHYCKQCKATHNMDLGQEEKQWTCQVCGTVHAPSEPKKPSVGERTCQ